MERGTVLMIIAIIIFSIIITLIAYEPLITYQREKLECRELCISRGMMKSWVDEGYCHCREVPENTFKLGDENA